MKFGGGSVPVWAIISNQGFVCWDFYKGRLNTDQYITLLDQHLVPAIKKYWPQGGEGLLTFMQDNASSHTSAAAQEYVDDLEGNYHDHFNILLWPSNSPDLNPIENVWSRLKEHLSTYEVPDSIDDLRDLLLQEIPKFNVSNRDYFTKLYRSMPGRVAKVIKAKGDAAADKNFGDSVNAELSPLKVLFVWKFEWYPFV